MADYGIDPWWMSHEPWVVPEPFTPEAGEMYSKEDIDNWIAVVAQHRARRPMRPLTSCAPRRTARPIRKIKGDVLDDPARWAMTWRAYRRKHRR